jgi:hypothetical protein
METQPATVNLRCPKCGPLPRGEWRRARRIRTHITVTVDGIRQDMETDGHEYECLGCRRCVIDIDLVLESQ